MWRNRSRSLTAFTGTDNLVGIMPCFGDVRLVALDIDGTLLERDATIVPQLVETLWELRHRGIELTTASGRPAEFQIALLKTYGLSAAFTALITDERELYLTDNATFVPYQQWNQQVRERWETVLFDRALEWLRLTEKEAARRGFPTTMFELDNMRSRGLATLECDSAEHATALR